jgi:glycosyltransferase involved in cell wall biosynthesis
VGNGSERSRLELLGSNLGVRDRVTFRGALAPAAMPDVYGGFDALVVPSRAQSNWKEQFGRVIIEAMACEVPVVGSDSGEIPNVIGDAGLVYPEGDVEALAERLTGLLGDDTLRAALARRSRRRVLEHFTQARVAERYYELYRSVLRETRSREAHGTGRAERRREGEGRG